MSVNIWLEDVPDAILEAVKARLMRRRKDLLEDNEQKKREASEPGPQLVEFGGDSDEWRRPEPGVVANRGVDVGEVIVREVETENGSGYEIETLSGQKQIVQPPAATITSGLEDYSLARSQRTGTPTVITNEYGEQSYGTTYTEYEVMTQDILSELNKTFLLVPIGRKKALICFFFRRYEIVNKISYSESTVTTYELSSIGVAYASSQSRSHLASTDNSNNFTFASVSFYVDQATIKQVQVPNDLIAEFNEYNPAITFNFQADEEIIVNQESGTFSGIGLGENMPPPSGSGEFIPTQGVVDFDFDDGQSSISSGSGTYSFTVGFFVPGKISLNLPETQYNPMQSRLVRIGDLSPLDDFVDDVTGNNRIVTPGVFTAIDKGEYLEEIDSVLTGEQLAGKYLSGIPLPRYSIIATNSNTSPGVPAEKVRFDLVRGIYAGEGDDPENPVKRIRNKRGLLRDDENGIYFWDWQNPVYCRLMCLELGFEPADLRP